jgi:exodeoxyribonuclease VII small subunit
MEPKSMPKKQNTPQSDKPDFETALKQLQEVVSRMENEQQSLDASIADYEKGTQLAAYCQQQLDAAQLKVEQLVKTKDGFRFETLDTTNDD